MPRLVGATLTALFLAACASPTIKDPSSAHLRADSIAKTQGSIPEPVQQTVSLPRPRASAKTETYSVVVNNVKVQDLLFALARDAKLNVDIHPGITGNVSLNAIDQSLPQLLTRISKQVDMRFELDGPNLAVMPDSPFLRTYKIDYVNMNRDTTGTVAVTTQVASGTPGATGAGGAAPAAAGGVAGANNSITRIENKSQNHFWETVTQNIKDILRETDKTLPEGSSETVVEQANAQSTTGTGAMTTTTVTRGAQNTPSLANSPNPAAFQNTGTTVVRRATFREAASVIAHPESGVLTVRATARQHEKIQDFLSQVIQSVKRQVLIEATVAEVSLSNDYQQGIDWSALPLGRAGFTVVQRAVGAITAPPSSLLQLSYNNQQSSVGAIKGAVNLLEGFGTVKVLSSPKISVMNNQTAVMKVVDNNVYFTLKADTTANANTSTTTFTTTLQSVPVGFVMNVTPQIGDGDSVMLNIRPSISSIVSYVPDPNPTLANPCGFGVASCSIPAIVSNIPVVRTREMESVIRVDNGNIAVMGGLIEDRVENVDNAVPGISRIPLLGEFFMQRRDQAKKTELVIFLRPVVLKDASMEGDYANLKNLLPRDDFFKQQPGNLGNSGRQSLFGRGNTP
jgi:MSHA type pilus biogenesis protein MshL